MYIKTTRYNQFDSIEIKETLFNEFTIPDHFHDSYCIGLVSEGIKKSIVEGSTSIIHSNSITVVNPYQVHSDQNIDKSATLFRMLYINKDVLNFFVRKSFSNSNKDILFTNELITDPLISQSILNFFDKMSEENLLENKLLTLIELLVNKYSIQNNSAPKNYKESFNAVFDSIELARLNFTDKIDVKKMAASCKLSRYQFIRYFKKLSGLTPASYIIVCRINYAKSLVIKGVPIGQIALDSGFYDHAQFCKFFKYYTGLSPSEYQMSCNIIQA